LRSNLRPISLFAVGLVLATAFLVAAVAHRAISIRAGAILAV
jgi:hypothetical protein